MLNSKLIRKKKQGFTLIELMIVVAIIGVLIALALPAFRDYFLRSKTVETGANLRNMFTSATTYYNGERVGTRGIAAAGTATAHCTVGSADGGLTPDDQKHVVDLPAADTDFAALGFSIADPIYYNYGWTSAAACGVRDAATYTFWAQGDLDADATISTFELAAGANADAEMYRAPGVYVINELE